MTLDVMGCKLDLLTTSYSCISHYLATFSYMFYYLFLLPARTSGIYSLYSFIDKYILVLPFDTMAPPSAVNSTSGKFAVFTDGTVLSASKSSVMALSRLSLIDCNSGACI